MGIQFYNKENYQKLIHTIKTPKMTENKVNDYMHAIMFINIFQTPRDETKATKKIRQNPEKWGCDSLRRMSMAAFHFY